MSALMRPGPVAQGPEAVPPLSEGISPPALIDLGLAARGAGPRARARLLAQALGLDNPTLGDLARAAWRLRARGAALQVLATCPSCAAQMEFDLPADFALPPASDAPLSVQGHDLRLPRLDDIGPQGLALAALSGPAAPWEDAQFRAEAEAALEAADPALSVTIALPCPDCGVQADHLLDPLLFAWDQIDQTSRRLLAEVSALARAFGWSEAAILALSPARRAAYLETLG